MKQQFETSGSAGHVVSVAQPCVLCAMGLWFEKLGF